MAHGFEHNVSNDPFLTHMKQEPRGPMPKPGRNRKKAVGIFAAGMPIPVFVLVSLSFTFLWHMVPLVPMLICAISFLYTFRSSLHHHVFGTRHEATVKEKVDMESHLLRCLSCILAVVLGTLTGLYAYEAYMSLFYTVAFGETYDNVRASIPAAAFGDAGKLHFAQTSVVNTQSAVGYKDKRTYCAAPIMDSGPDSLQTRTVGFWAIGFDCCGARGSFECGSAGNVTAHGGIRVPPDGFLDRSHGEFMRAIRQAAAVYDLVPQEELVLLHWVQDPDSMQWGVLLQALVVNALGMGLFILLVLVMSVASLWNNPVGDATAIDNSVA